MNGQASDYKFAPKSKYQVTNISPIPSGKYDTVKRKSIHAQKIQKAMITAIDTSKQIPKFN